MFSTICICFSTSISRSAACSCSVTPRRSAASCAPRRMSTKNGWFSVLSTSATVGLPALPVEVAPRLQLIESASATTRQVFFIRSPRRPSKGRLTFGFSALRVMLSLQHRVQQHGDDDDAADDDLLAKRRYTEQVEAPAPHAHDPRSS